MNAKKALANRYSTIAWGILLLYTGVLMGIPGDQNGLFWLGTGAIFLGLNLFRRMNQIPLNPFSMTLGFLALAVGLYIQLRPIINSPHFEVGIVPLVLIIGGLYVIIPRPKYADD